MVHRVVNRMLFKRRGHMRQEVVKLFFRDVLEYTLIRGESVGEKIHRMAYSEMQNLNPQHDYQNMDVTLYTISADAVYITVIFNIKEHANV